MRSRLPAALALFLSTLLAVAHSNALAGQPDPKDKGPDKSTGKIDSGKAKEPEWPSDIGGKPLSLWLKDVVDPDPAIRDAALQTLPAFGPKAREQGSKLILARMTAERDPAVRITVLTTAAAIGFSDPNDEKEAIRLLGVTADTGAPGGLSRLHAVQTLGSIGPKASGATVFLTGRVIEDPSYQTRRAVAVALGLIAFGENTGPNAKALSTLATVLARDVSVSVRMEALQSLVSLGPPWAAVRKAGGPPPPIDEAGAKVVADAMRSRLDPKLKALETDAQLAIWCRVVLMRFDPKETSEANLAAIAKHLSSPEVGPKVHALQALALFGEFSAKQIDEVVKVLEDRDGKDVQTDPQVLNSALLALGAMGSGGQPAIPALELAEKRLAALRDKRLKEPEVIKLLAPLKPEEKERAIATLAEEQIRKSVVDVIKWIKASKPGMPGGELATPMPPMPEPKKG